MKKLPVLFALLLGSGCAMTKTHTTNVPNWSFDATSEAELVAQHRLACDSGIFSASCTIGGQPVTSAQLQMAANAYPRSKELGENAATRDGVLLMTNGLTLGLTILGGIIIESAPSDGSEAEMQTVGVGVSALGGALLTLATTMIIGAVWDPLDDLNEVYNEELAQDVHEAHLRAEQKSLNTGLQAVARE